MCVKPCVEGEAVSRRPPVRRTRSLLPLRRGCRMRPSTSSRQCCAIGPSDNGDAKFGGMTVSDAQRLRTLDTKLGPEHLGSDHHDLLSLGFVSILVVLSL